METRYSKAPLYQLHCKTHSFFRPSFIRIQQEVGNILYENFFAPLF